MDIKERFSVLFDFDGVVMDTESQYSVFWHQIGVEYLQHDNLEQIIKGQTLTTIFNTYFKGLEDKWENIDNQLKYFEQHMKYEYIDGFEDFLHDLVWLKPHYGQLIRYHRYRFHPGLGTYNQN